MKYLLLSLLLCLVPLKNFAQNQDLPVPPIIDDGFKKYKMKGLVDALKEWNQFDIKSKNDASKLTTFQEAEKTYDKYVDFDVVDYVELSRRNALVYVIVNYEKGPLFVLFTVFYPDNKWIVSRINASLDVKDVFPDYIWTRTK